MGNRPEGSGFYRILLAVETDATHFYGAHASRPGLLGATDSEQMLSARKKAIVIHFITGIIFAISSIMVKIPFPLPVLSW